MRWIRAENVSGIEQRLNDHTIAIHSRAVTSQDWVNGEKLSPIEWPAGAVAFAPAGSDIKTSFSCPFTGTIFRLETRYFSEAARDHIEYSKINLRFGRIDSTAVSSIVGALQQIAPCEDFAKWPLLVESLALSMSVALIREMSPEANSILGRLRGGLDLHRKRRVIDFVESNMHRPITLNELADVAALSPYHFARSFKQSTGLTPLKYMAQRRAEAAKKLMRAGTMSLSMVAMTCGFSSQQHFSTAFRAVTGLSPTEFMMKDKPDVPRNRRSRRGGEAQNFDA